MSAVGGNVIIDPSNEPHVRLTVFGLALIAVAVRGCTLTMNDMGIPVLPAAVNDWASAEARAIVDAVIAEAHRLEQQGNKT